MLFTTLTTKSRSTSNNKITSITSKFRDMPRLIEIRIKQGAVRIISQSQFYCISDDGCYAYSTRKRAKLYTMAAT